MGAERDTVGTCVSSRAARVRRAIATASAPVKEMEAEYGYRYKLTRQWSDTRGGYGAEEVPVGGYGGEGNTVGWGGLGWGGGRSCHWNGSA